MARIKWSEMVGQTANGFKILEYKRENGRTYILVICPLCKEKKWIRPEILQDNKTRSCGCYNKEHNAFKKRDITGETFGRLTAIKETKNRDDNGSVIWECKCSCGNVAYCSAKDLRNGDVKSCGCLGKENSRKNGKHAGAVVGEKYCVEGTNINNLTAQIPKNNTSGIKGVCWDKKRKKWVAQIGFKGYNYHLGRFDTKEEAGEARKKAEKEKFENFLEWYYSEYPEKRKKGKKRK